jgi:restriction system protein
MKYLERFPEYQAFKSRTRERARAPVTAGEIDQTTPEEMLESGYQALRSTLAADILQLVKGVSPAFFERLVMQLLLKMGYGGTRDDAGQVVGKSGDGGIDGIINEDRLGLDVIYIQAKRWDGDVGRPEIQKFVGALAGNKASKGVFITTSGFSKEARAYAGQVNSKVVLIDGAMLADLMIDYNIGVSTRETYEIKRVDSDFFAED